MKFKIGDRVRLAKSSRYYGEHPRYNPAGVEGSVVRVVVDDSIRVKWDSGGYNYYYEDDLELTEEVLYEI